MTVMLMVVILTGVVTVAVTASVQALHGGGLDRKRTQAISAAEAGVNTALAALQSATGTAVPCTIAGQLADRTSYTATLTYYGTYPPTSSALSCDPASGVSAQPAAAVISSSGSAPAAYADSGSLGDRAMRALVRLSSTPAQAPTFTKAVFSDASVTLTNAWKLIGVDGTDASLYTNGNFSCNSTPIIDGGVLAQGTVNLTNTCYVKGDVWANGAITTSTNNLTIDGSLKSSTAGVRFGNHGVSIGEDIIVAGSVISSDGRPVRPGGQTYEHVTGLRSPPSATMPHVMFDPSAWPGFTVASWSQVVQTSAQINHAPDWSSATAGECDQLSSDDWSLNGPLRTPNAPTIIDAYSGANRCGLRWMDLDIVLNSDATIFMPSLTSSNGVRVTSGDGEQHDLRLIVPWPAGAADCDGTSRSSDGGLTFDSGGTALPNTVNLLLYTPGEVSLTNEVDFYGQIYGCSLEASVDITVRYVRVGAESEGDRIATPYKVDVAYLRETR